MHIAFVNNTHKWGGVKTWCLAMAKSFQEAGHWSGILGQEPVFIQKALDMGLNAVCKKSGPDYNPFAIAFYRRYFLDHGVDVVVVNVGKDVRTAGIAARLCGIPVIHRVGAPRDFRSTFQTRLDCRLLRPRFICCSQFVLDAMRREAPHSAMYEGVAIHPGVVVPPEPRAGRAPGPRRIITTSRLSGEKRHLDLLKALALLRAEGFEFHLTIVGDGPTRPSLEAYAEASGIAPFVTFAGFTTHVESCLDAADIFVLPTWCEPLGISLEEAMAAGLVPVARNAGGVPEIWPPFCKELLVEQHSDAEGFAGALRDLLNRPEADLEALGARVQDHARDCFAQEKQFRKFYDWLCEK